MTRNVQHRQDPVGPFPASTTPPLTVVYRGQVGTYTGYPGVRFVEREIAAGNVPGIAQDIDVSLDGYIVDLASRTVRPSTAFAFGGAR